MDIAEIRKKARERKKSPDAVSPPQVKTVEDAGDAVEHERENLVAEKGGPEGFSDLRSVLVSQRQEEEREEEELLHLLTFMLGREEYALNIMDVKEIVRPRAVTEVPGTPPFVLGILSLRGTIIPVMDVEARLGLPFQNCDTESRIVIVRWREHFFGLLVDRVVQVMKVPVARVDPPPEIIGGVGGEYLRGVAKMDDRLVILLNLGRLLPLEEEPHPPGSDVLAGVEE